MLRTLASLVAAAGVATLATTGAVHDGAAAATPQTPHVAAASQIAAGRYLVVIGGCNDCHTPGWPESDGHVPQAKWLTGSSVGFHGPWGTSYPANLRRIVSGLSEAQWIALTRTPMRPPMPSYVFSKMSPQDLRAMYAFIKSLGPAGSTAPSGLRPGEVPRTPVYEFVPVVQRSMRRPL